MRKAGDNGMKIYEEDLLNAFMVARMPTDKVRDHLMRQPGIREIAEMLDTVFTSDTVMRLRDLFGDLPVTVLGGLFIGAVKSDDIGNLVLYRLLLEEVLAPVVGEIESLKTMVHTLTVSKEISEAQEEDND